MDAPPRPRYDAGSATDHQAPFPRLKTDPMNLPPLARSRPVDAETAAHLTRQIREIRDIYETLLPTQHLHFILRLGNDPLWSHPEVTEGPHVPRPGDLGADFLGCLERPGSRDDSP